MNARSSLKYDLVCVVFSNLIIFSTVVSGIHVRCIQNGRFYRDPDRPPHKVWTPDECAKYFLCLDDEVFEFKCSSGLLFDVYRQICDFKVNVDNCDTTAEQPIPIPLMEKARCTQKDHLGCADSTCLPEKYFCDGAIDCPDGSDEGHCDHLIDDPHKALPCNVTLCKLPNCFCSEDGTAIPGNLLSTEVPQMILLTFDDAINSDNFELYSKVLLTSDRTNPDGCPVRATFFVSHQYNNYHQTQQLWNDGHEIAVHSITHRGPEEWWSFNATIEDWFDEMVGQANILHKFSKIRLKEMRGLRVPFLKLGWDRQFLMMEEFGFLYDSSIIAPVSTTSANPPLWPYTMDYKIPHSCRESGQNCPTRSYPGIWEMVMNQLEGDGFTCPMVDACPQTLTEDQMYTLLMHNFKRHYLTNRAPFDLFIHSKWFKRPDYSMAFQRFMDDILQQGDVWFVTNYEAIEWMRNPTPLNKIEHFLPWTCHKKFHQSEVACEIPNVCRVFSRVFQQDRMMYTCTECPNKYPWLRNEFGVD